MTPSQTYRIARMSAMSEECRLLGELRTAYQGLGRNERQQVKTLLLTLARTAFGTNSTQESNSMEAIGLLVTLEARRGKEADAEAFLKSAQPLAVDEKGTLKWYAIKLGPGKFGIFDTFANEGGRNAHLTGEIAKALGARANELLAVPPQIEKVEVLASTPLKG